MEPVELKPCTRKRRKHITVEYLDSPGHNKRTDNLPSLNVEMTSSSRFTRLKSSAELLKKTCKTSPDLISEPSKAVQRDAGTTWRPPNWQKVLANVRLMRAAKDAPVDTMGAEQCADSDAAPEVQRFQILVSLMLSSQTKDQVTYAAMQKLKEHGLTIENILQTDENVISQLIYPVGFWKRKASYIRKTAEVLANCYNGDIPSSIKELCTLPGVGPKMATICANIAWEKTAGIGVDTHVHRISNRLGWVPEPTKTPKDTQKALEKWLPPQLWKEVNVLFVGFGQQLCTPARPNCKECLNKTLCPFGVRNLKM